MKHRAVLVGAGLVAAALATSLGVAAAGTNSKGSRARPAARTAVSPPRVPNAAALRRKFKGQKITFIGDNIGLTHQRDLKIAARFSKDTGIKVNVIPHPASGTAAYSQLARLFSSKSSSADVVMLDVIWPGAFAPYLIDLKKALRKEVRVHAKGIVQNDTVGGRLIAMPWFGDFGILYYRTDLLRKYGFSHPPRTWSELESQAKKIQAGERKDNPNFYGFVWQGNAYEGLTCDALEWIASSGGGTFIQNGKVTINNSKAAGILKRVQGWVGKIAPRGVTSYQETEALNAFDGGNAAFLRNWPYAYSVSQTTKIKGKFNVTVLPHGKGGNSVGTVGGWQLGVSKFSKHKAAAIEFVRYATSAGVQKFNAIFSSNPPTIPAVALNRAVVRANPWLKPQIARVARVTRPSRELKAKYQQGSTIIFQGLNQIENGASVNSTLRSIERKLKRLVR